MNKKKLEQLVDEAIHFLMPVFKLESEPRKLQIRIAYRKKNNYLKGHGRVAAQLYHEKGTLTFYKPFSNNKMLLETIGEEAGHWIHYQMNPAIFTHCDCTPGEHVGRLIAAYSYIGKKAPYNKTALEHTNVVNFCEFVGAVAGIIFAREKCKNYRIDARKELTRTADYVSWCVNSAIPFYQTGVCEGSRPRETGAAVNHMSRVLGEMAAYRGISEKDLNSDLSRYARMPLAKAKTFFNRLIGHMRAKGKRD